MTRRLFVDELFKNGRIQHGETGDEETGVDTLDRGEVDPHPPESGVDDPIKDGDEDDDRDGIQVLNQIIGGSVQCHAGGNGTQVTIDLGVAQPEEGEPAKHLACLEGASDFTNELVVPGDLRRDCALLVGAGLGDIPETRPLEILPGSDGVCRNPGTSGHCEDTDAL